MATDGRALAAGKDLLKQRTPANFENKLRVTRRFPLSGTIHVHPGQQVVARTLLGEHSADERLHVLRVDICDGKMQGVMIRNVGDSVKAGEAIALGTYAFGLGLTEYCSPTDGSLVAFDASTGIVTIQEHPEPLYALLSGTVERVIRDEAVVIDTDGIMIEGAYGEGLDAGGRLVILSEDESADAQAFDPAPDLVGAVGVIRGRCGRHQLMAALRARMAGLIAGSGDLGTVLDFLDYVFDLSREEFEARYGSRRDAREYIDDDGYEPSMGIILTEGFGSMAVREEVFDVLRRAAGRHVFLGIPDVHSDHREPPRIILAAAPNEHTAGVCLSADSTDIRPGARVRLLGRGRLGTFGTVVRLADGLYTGPGGTKHEAATVRTDDGRLLKLPLRNLQAV